jgi:putative hemolysin
MRHGAYSPSMAELLVVFACIVLNGFLSCVEMAFVSASRPELQRLAAQAHAGARMTLVLRRRPERTLSVLQIGITALGAIAAALGGAAAQEELAPHLESRLGMRGATAEALAIALVVGPLTYSSIVAGELVPKSLALRQPVRIAVRSARWLVLLDKLLAPFVWLLEASTRGVLRVLFRAGLDAQRESLVPPAEAVDLAELSVHHRQYVVNFLEIERKRVSEILVDWGDVVSVRFDQTAQEVQDVVFASAHTRLPVLRGDEVIGLLHTKEFLAFHAGGGAHWPLLLRPILQLDGSVSLIAALRRLQDARSHMAVVTSRESRLGIVTLESIFEEIVGEIHDEDDDDVARRWFVRRPRER